MTANSSAFAVVCLGCALARVDSVIMVDKDNLAAQDLPSICTRFRMSPMTLVNCHGGLRSSSFGFRALAKYEDFDSA